MLVFRLFFLKCRYDKVRMQRNFYRVAKKYFSVFLGYIQCSGKKRIGETLAQ